MAGKSPHLTPLRRALAKETDGDFTKFVLRTQKPRDMAQKWRAFKNISRFFKNPWGYTFWKVAQLSSQNRIRIMWGLLLFHLYQSFILYLVTKMKKESMIGKWKWHIGETNQFYDSPHNDRRFPADRKKNYVRYSNFHQVRKNKKISMIHTNWWCRDQNFRKYFDMRKRHNIEPSMSGFYHDKILADSNSKIMAFAAQRASQKSA